MTTITDTDTSLNIFLSKPDRHAPIQASGVIGWLRLNLFNGWFNSILTVFCLCFLWKTLPPVISWAFIDATWVDNAGHADGAGWGFIIEKFRVLMVGVYPEAFLMRPVLATVLFGFLCCLTFFRKLSTFKLMGLWLILPFPVYWLINGGMGLEFVDQSLWGGLMLSMLLAVVGVLFSLPLGVVLALGRRSRFAAIKSFCVGFIELIRGVPLITILFMASVMLPIFLPEGVNINNLLRVQIGIIFFSSAYMAEVVRGGLQAVSPGQTEAAQSLGLKDWQITALVVLPQALRHVIPSLIGRCVALFKDTSLVIIVGLLDFLGMIKASAQDPEWLGHDVEAYVFCALIYWIICFSISRYGRSIEKNSEW